MNDPEKPDETPGWFDRKENVQKLLRGLYIGCGVLVFIDVMYRVFGFDKHPYFRWEQWPGFYGAYGFIACVVIVAIAKYLLRPLVRRDEDFYREKPAKEQEKGGTGDV